VHTRASLSPRRADEEALLCRALSKPRCCQDSVAKVEILRMPSVSAAVVSVLDHLFVYALFFLSAILKVSGRCLKLYF